MAQLTLEQAREGLKKYQAYNKRYQGYPGSGGDDARLGIYGYTVREERGYIRRQVRFYNAAIKEMERRGVESLTDRECFYLIY